MVNSSSIQKVVAIDGPSGSGKSTLAKQLAQKCQLLFVDTGAMYRAIAYSCEKDGIPFQEGDQLKNYLDEINIEYSGVEGENYIIVNSRPLGERIRDHHVSTLASQVSQLPSVRTHLVDYQRKLVEDRCCVMEGRDIGTVVFPNAFCKVYLTANDQVRAQRRLDQLKQKGQTGLSLEEVIKDVQKRDQSDMQRSHSPLKQADDAVLLDTSDMNHEEVLNALVEIVKQKSQEFGVDL